MYAFSTIVPSNMIGCVKRRSYIKYAVPASSTKNKAAQ
jgi:hypothetical protein